MNRRQLLQAMGALVLLATARRAWPRPRLWAELDDLASRLRTSNLSPEAWGQAMEHLYDRVGLTDILAAIDMETLLRDVHWPERGSAIVAVPGPHTGGVKLFAHQRDRGVPPHVHNGMASTHLVISGRFRARTWDRELANEEADRVIALQPRRNDVVGPGDVITMSDREHNGHGLHALTDLAVTLDVPVTGLDGGPHWPSEANVFSMIFIDPTPLPAKGLIRAPVIGVTEALRRFG